MVVLPVLDAGEGFRVEGLIEGLSLDGLLELLHAVCGAATAVTRSTVVMMRASVTGPPKPVGSYWAVYPASTGRATPVT